MAALRLTLLGGFQAALGSGQSLRFPTRKAQALLAYLATQPGRACAREKLAGLLWGGLNDENARSNLRQALFVLRQSLPRTTPPCLVCERASVLLRASLVDVDVVRFEQCAAEGSPPALEKAAALYRGDLLESFAVPEAAFDEWLTGERERLRAVAIEALTKLLAHQAKAGAAGRGIQTALRLIGLDPLQESTHRALMGLYAGQGRWAAALKQYQSCVDLLQRELGVDPEPETRQLYQDILEEGRGRRAAAEPGKPPRVPSPAPVEHGSAYGSAPGTTLAGRNRELVELRETMERMWRSHGLVVSVVGEAGIGKTRLTEEVASEATQRGGRVLLGRGHESERVLPFGPWVDAVRRGCVLDEPEAVGGLGATWRAELARLFPEAGEERTDQRREPAEYLRLFEAIARLLEQLTARQPLLLILENLHWADEMSLRLLSFIGRRVHRWRALIVGTARAEEIADAPALRHALQELREEECVREMSLTRLSHDETRQLARSLRRPGPEAIPAAFADKVWSVSEGNPFMIVETIRGLRAGAPPPTDRIALPDRIRHLLTHRLDRLSEAGRALAGIAAVIGRDFDFMLLQRAAAFEESRAAAGVEELVRRGVLRAAGDHFQFVHDWMREVADAQVLSPTRALLHRKVGAALEELNADNLEPHYAALGLHFEQGENWQKALIYLRLAGLQAAARSAHRQAIKFVERALVALGRLPTCHDLTEQAIDLRFDLRNSFAPLGEWQLMSAPLREAEALAETLADRRRLARALSFATEQLCMTGDHRRALATGERALALAGTCGDDLAIEVTTNRQLVRVHHALGDYQRAAERLRWLLATLSGDLLYERFDSPPIASVSSHMLRAWCLADLGEFAEARVSGEEALRIAEAADHPLSTAQACHALGFALLERGDVPAATVTLGRALSLINKWDLTVLIPIVASTLGAAHVAAGRVAEAIPLLEQAVEAAKSRGRMEGQALRLAWLAHAHGRAGRSHDALRLALEGLGLAREQGERGREARVLQILGDLLAQADETRRRECESYYRRGLGLAETLGMRPLTARCHLGLAQLLQRLRRRTDARTHRNAAAKLYRDMGMPLG